jgi:predicted HTH transcriptional regulator
MTAFANSSGGRILIGVCDDGTLEGMTAKKEYEAHIMNIARDRCNSPLVPKFYKVKKPEGDVYVVKFFRYRTFPHAVITRDGQVYFIRVGTTVREATPSELALLFESSRGDILRKPMPMVKKE